MRSDHTPLRRLIASVMTIALATTALVVVPTAAAASPPDALTRVSTVAAAPAIGTVHDVDYDGGRLAIADTQNDVVIVGEDTIGGTVGSGPGEFDDPRGVAWGPSLPNTLYVADSGNERVQEFVLAEGSWVYSDEWSFGVGSDPRGLDFGNGLVYVADAGLDVVHVIDPTVDPTVGVTTFAGGLSAPQGVAIDGTHVLVANTGNDAVLRYSAGGALLDTIAGLNDPADLTADGEGNVFVTQLFTDDIRAFDSAGNTLFTFGGNGAGIDRFDNPRGIAAVDGTMLYIADSDNKRIELYRHSAEVTFAVTSVDVIEDGGSADVAVELSQAADAPVTVGVYIGGGTTAANPADYTLVTTSIVIPAGETSATATVNITEDVSGAEETEIVQLALGTPKFAVLGDVTTATVTIEDDDIVARDDNWEDRYDENEGDLSLVTNTNETLVISI